MSAAEVLARVIRERYDQCGQGRWPMENSLADYLLEHLPAAGVAVVELPDNPEDWHVNDVGTVGVYLGESGVNQTGVQIHDVGFDLVTTATEARQFAAALLAAADASEVAS